MTDEGRPASVTFTEAFLLRNLGPTLGHRLEAFYEFDRQRRGHRSCWC